MKFIEIKQDELGFKVAKIPNQINTMTLWYSCNDEEQKFIKDYLRGDFIIAGKEPNSNEYYSGNYYYKATNNAEYFVLESEKIIGLMIRSKISQGEDIKSALYNKSDDTIRLQAHTDSLDESSHNFRRFASNEENKIFRFNSEEMEAFKGDFIQKCGECENLDKIIDISTLITVMVEKGIVNKR